LELESKEFELDKEIFWINPKIEFEFI
jgi:hypothetical protein